MPWQEWWQRWRKTDEQRQEEEEKKVQEEMLQEIERAKREWLQAHTRLDCVTDPELIDHAIYLLGAAEKRYTYLLRNAREQGLCRKPYRSA